MNVCTTVSGKGQVVIPKDVGDRRRIAVGDVLDVVERPDNARLRKTAPAKSGESFEAITARIRSRVIHDGPAVSIDDMNVAIGEMWAAGSPRWDR